MNITDLVIVARNFGLAVSNPVCDERADLNGDLEVDIQDLIVVAVNFGNTA